MITRTLSIIWELPSDTKLLLTKNYFEIIIFEKTTIFFDVINYEK